MWGKRICCECVHGPRLKFSREQRIDLLPEGLPVVAAACKDMGSGGQLLKHLQFHLIANAEVFGHAGHPLQLMCFSKRTLADHLNDAVAPDRFLLVY